MPVWWNVFTGRCLRPLLSSINTDAFWAAGVIGWERACGIIKGHVCPVLQPLVVQAPFPLFPSSPCLPCAAGRCRQCATEQKVRWERRNSPLTNARFNHVFGISWVRSCENTPRKLRAVTQAGSSGTVAQLHKACRRPFCTREMIHDVFNFPGQ